jgi:hypothetical protein
MRKSKKLHLKRETLRNLGTEGLGIAKGGGSAACTYNWTQLCTGDTTGGCSGGCATDTSGCAGTNNCGTGSATCNQN